MLQYSKFPPRKTIYVDVDETLIIDGQVNRKLVRFLRGKALDGWVINVWSMRGDIYSAKAVKRCGLGGIVTHTLSKPGIVIDDQAWDWTSWVKTLDPTMLLRNDL